MNRKLEALILMLMCFMLGMGIVVQINTVKNNGTTNLSNQETSDLKTQVLKMKERYEAQYEALEKATKELEEARQNAASSDSEFEELESKIKKDNLLLGNTNVTGPGVTITLTDGRIDQQTIDVDNLLIHDGNVLTVVNELKNAGAEAIAINGERVVGTTAISCDGNVIIVNGEKISSPIEITAIGLAEQLATLNRAGGILELFQTYGKNVDFKKSPNKIEISKFTGVYNYKYIVTK